MPEFHNDFNNMQAHIEAVDDAVKGSIAVKSKGYNYLPHPSEADKTSPTATNRYKQYLSGAEFDTFPSKTLSTLLGKLSLDDVETLLPPKIDYLLEDIDADGLTSEGALRQCASNIIKNKWHILVADYSGLSDVDTADLSIADLNVLKPRATVKQYSRGNVVNWSFDRINGVMQLTFIMLREVGTNFDTVKLEHTEVTSYLVLALDEAGYYQQKIIEIDDVLEYGKQNRVMVGGSSLKFLPVVIASDGEPETGSMPTELGFLSTITDLAYSRYIMSAEYKEAMRNLPPTTYTRGWTPADWDNFKQINGRDYIATGSGQVNNLPGDVQVEIVGVNTQLEGYERYFAENKSKVQALGGVFSEDNSGNKTATQAAMESIEQNAMLVDLSAGLEIAFKKVFSYCALFEGVPDSEIKIELSKDFNAVKLTVEEVREIQNLVMNGLYTTEQAINALTIGGWHSGDAVNIMNQINEDLPTIQKPVALDIKPVTE